MYTLTILQNQGHPTIRTVLRILKQEISEVKWEENTNQPAASDSGIASGDSNLAASEKEDKSTGGTSSVTSYVRLAKAKKSKLVVRCFFFFFFLYCIPTFYLRKKIKC